MGNVKKKKWKFGYLVDTIFSKETNGYSNTAIACCAYGKKPNVDEIFLKSFGEGMEVEGSGIEITKTNKKLLLRLLNENVNKTE